MDSEDRVIFLPDGKIIKERDLIIEMHGKSPLKLRIWEEVLKARPLPNYLALMEEILITAEEEELQGEVSPEEKYGHWLKEREGIVLDWLGDVYVVLDVERHTIMRCPKAIISKFEIPIVGVSGYISDPEDYQRYQKQILKILQDWQQMNEYSVTVNLRQVGTSEHHPWEMGSFLRKIKATSLEEAVKKAYELESGKPFSEFTPFINTVEGRYVLLDMEITEFSRGGQTKRWRAKIKEGGEIIIEGR